MAKLANHEILVGRAGRSKNGCSSSKLSLPYFLVKICPQTKFHQNRSKNVEVGKFRYKTILVGRAGRSKNGRSYLKRSFFNWRVTNDLCTKFEPNRIKNGKVSPS